MLPILFVTASLPLSVRVEARPEPAVRLTVSPVGAPKPALQYQLLPTVAELSPGNPVQWYTRCFAEQRTFFFGKQATDERARYLAMPLAALATERLENYGGSALSQADWAARLDTPDWEALARVLSEGTSLVLPELRSFRILGTGLRVRARGEVARKDFTAAIRTIKTMFAFARHLGDHPTLAGNLLGLTVADLALDTLEEMVQQPGCPNLYWALTDLPGPPTEIRKGAQGARTMADTELPPIRDDEMMTDAQIDDVVGQISGRLGLVREQAGRPPRSLRTALKSRVADPARFGPARTRLMDAARAGSLIEQVSALRVVGFSTTQVILVDEKREFAARCDEEMKLLALPPWQAAALLPAQGQARWDGLFADFLPGIRAARNAQARVEQRVAVLRHVEALRMFAASHSGSFPGGLAEMAVPLPVDPFTGKPFAYSPEAGIARIGASVPPDGDKPPTDTRWYEVALRK